jgi:hypothetical protein
MMICTALLGVDDPNPPQNQNSAGSELWGNFGALDVGNLGICIIELVSGGVRIGKGEKKRVI